MAAVFGLVCGSLFHVRLDERRRRTVQHAEDVEYYTRMPLLAAIPRTTTEEERRRLKSRARALLAVGVAVAFVSTIALTRLLIITEILASLR